MGVIRNLGGMQKGLLGGLILGILVVYLCLCISATGIIPLSPHIGPLGSVSTAVAVDLSTDTPVPTATAPPTATPAPSATATETPAPTEPPATDTPTLEPTATPTEMARVAMLVAEPEATEIPRVQPAVVRKPAAAPPVADEPAAVTSPQPPPTPEWTWRGIEYDRIPGTKTGNVFGIIAVRVVGVPNRKVFINEVLGGWSTTLVTGQKPQYGEFSDDVGGLAAGAYVVKPMDIDDQISVQINPGDFVLVEFALRPPANWTPEPPTQAQVTAAPPPPATKVAVVAPAKPAVPATVAAPAGAVETVAPTPIPDWTWQGIEFQRIPGTQSHNPVGTLAVRVVGVPNRKVFIREMSGGWSATLVTGQKPAYGDFSDDLGGLSPGTYNIKPMDIDNEITVQINRGDFVLVEFALRPTHPLVGGGAAQPTGPAPAAAPLAPAASPAPAAKDSGDWAWQGIEYQRILGTQSHSGAGALAVRIVGVPDRKVLIREASGGWSTTLVTGRKAQYGQFGDDVGGLSPGTYLIKPMDIDNEVAVQLSTGDFVLIEFALRPTKPLKP